MVGLGVTKEIPLWLVSKMVIEVVGVISYVLPVPGLKPMLCQEFLAKPCGAERLINVTHGWRVAAHASSMSARIVVTSRTTFGTTV